MWQKLTSLVKRYGLLPIHRSGFITVQRIGSRRSKLATDTQLSIEVVNPSDEQVIQELVDFSVGTSWYTPENARILIDGFLQRGDQCLIARHESRIVSRFWVQLDGEFWGLSPRRTIRLEPDQVYCYDAYTEPAMRNKGILSYMSWYVDQCLNNRPDKRYALTWVKVGNVPSLIVHRKLHAVRTHRAGSVHWLNRSYYYGWYNPLSKSVTKKSVDSTQSVS